MSLPKLLETGVRGSGIPRRNLIRGKEQCDLLISSPERLYARRELNQGSAVQKSRGSPSHNSRPRCAESPYCWCSTGLRFRYFGR